jgi:hypothetical protein
MPYKMKKTKGGKYRVTGPSGVHAKGTSKSKAKAQIRIMEASGHTTLSPNLVGHEGLFKMVNSSHPDGKEMKNWKSGAVRRDIEH